MSQNFNPFKEICPEMQANEMHELYDRHHKVSPNLNYYESKT